MREIKFRGKRLNDFNQEKEWVYGQYQAHNLWDGTPANNVRHAIHYLYLNEHPGCNGHMLNEMEYISVKTLGQYIGMKDINDVEIYEGDILKDRYGEIFEVQYCNENCAFGSLLYAHKEFYLLKDFENVKVIGNIYENPELLEV